MRLGVALHSTEGFVGEERSELRGHLRRPQEASPHRNGPHSAAAGPKGRHSVFAVHQRGVRHDHVRGLGDEQVVAGSAHNGELGIRRQ